MNMSSFTIFDQSSSAFISGESHISPVFARRNTAAALKQFHKVLLVLIADLPILADGLGDLRDAHIGSCEQPLCLLHADIP